MKQAHKITLILPEYADLDMFETIVNSILSKSEGLWTINTPEGVKTVSLQDFSLKHIAGGSDAGILFEFEHTGEFY